MKRSKHTLSHYRLNTANMGELFPISCIPVLPGDTVQMHTNALVRVSPLNTPVMHPTQVRIHHFYVPNRIVWDSWEDFITGGPDGNNSNIIPTIGQTTAKKNILSYLGVPPLDGLSVNALPVRAVNRIINEYYRDQDVTPERADNELNPARCAWEKDYFTTARPWSQKGPDVTVPVGTRADVLVDSGDVAAGDLVTLKGDDLNSYGMQYPGTPGIQWTGGTNPITGDGDLYADLANATGVSVNDFRASFAIQRYQEARARYGSRFTEYLRYLGINPSDARLQRPEFLGGGSARLQFSEVLQTSAGKDAPDPGTRDEWGVGDMYGHGIAGARTNRFRKFFEEHGYIITMMSVRPKSMYVNGIPREFIKTTKEDYFQKELANLGQQEVYDAELYGTNGRTVFGYQDRYHEYRSQPSQVGQDFRDTLNAYHMGRDLALNPVLNDSFIRCTPTDRIFQVSETTADTLWIMANHHVVARRIVPKRANPRIL